jgi:WD40 repeat protein
MSISSEDNNIIVWDLNTLQNILNIVNINTGGVLYSACFLWHNDEFYVVTSNCSQSPFYINYDPIKIFDSNGQLIKEINESKERTYFMDAYYDNKITNKKYIVTCNFNYLKSYDYEKNELYQKYYDKDEGAHFTFDIYDYNDKQVNIIESSNMGTIRIWNFHTGDMLNKIAINNKRFFSVCLWNNDYLFAGCEDGSIKLIEVQNSNIIYSLDTTNNSIAALTIKKIKIEKYGECLISKGFKEDQIKIWA